MCSIVNQEPKCARSKWLMSQVGFYWFCYILFCHCCFLLGRQRAVALKAIKFITTEKHEVIRRPQQILWSGRLMLQRNR